MRMCLSMCGYHDLLWHGGAAGGRACDVGSMPINAGMMRPFNLGQMAGQAWMHKGAISFTARSMAGLSHGSTSDSVATAKVKRQAATWTHMLRTSVKSLLPWRPQITAFESKCCATADLLSQKAGKGCTSQIDKVNATNNIIM